MPQHNMISTEIRRLTQRCTPHSGTMFQKMRGCHAAILHSAAATQGCTPHLGHRVGDIVDAQVPRAVVCLKELPERLVACARQHAGIKDMHSTALVAHHMNPYLQTSNVAEGTGLAHEVALQRRPTAVHASMAPEVHHRHIRKRRQRSFLTDVGHTLGDARGHLDTAVHVPL